MKWDSDYRIKAIRAEVERIEKGDFTKGRLKAFFIIVTNLLNSPEKFLEDNKRNFAITELEEQESPAIQLLREMAIALSTRDGEILLSWYEQQINAVLLGEKQQLQEYQS